MNSEEYKKGISLYEDLVEEYIVQKVHYLIKVEKRINNIDYFIKALRDIVFDSNINHAAFNAFNDICLNTRNDYGIYVLIKDEKGLKTYKNLETEVEVIISVVDNNVFIQNNRVIIPKNIDSALSFYKSIRKEFFRLLTNNSENESITRILTRRI